jgi:hypothetical protein
MPRYVILEHDHPSLHWDFLLETGAVLRAWRLAATPQLGAAVPAEASFDHRLIYLDYEGPVSGNRGSVRRWDSGTYTLLAGEMASASTGPIRLALAGVRLSGAVVLERTAGGGWQLRYEEGPG